MGMPRRPRFFRELQIDSYEFQLIGEIVVLCGLLEQLLRELPIYLIGADRDSAYAFTAHLNFQSLCDLNLTLLTDYISDPRDRKFLEDEIKKAAKLYDDRSRIVHGPFHLYPSGIKGTLRVTARRQIKRQAYRYDKEVLQKLLSEIIDVFYGLDISVMMQKIEWWQQVRQNN